MEGKTSVYLENLISLPTGYVGPSGLSDDSRRNSVPQEKGVKAPSKEDR
jgi:hypothetical protein